MFNKMWVRLFLKIAAIFTVFVLVLALSNSTLLLNYYVFKEKAEMKAVAADIDEVQLYADDSATQLSNIISEQGYTLRITDSFGNMLFYSSNSPVADYKGFYDPKIQKDIPNKFDDKGFYISKSNGGTGEDIMVLTHQLSGGETLTLGIELALLKNSAAVANEFMIAVAVVCLLASLVWVLFLSKKIAQPIRQMQETTSKMAALDFSQKLQIESDDEIGQLADSINTLSATLNETLVDLKDKNQQLRGEIEAERRLDKMRKGFVANVSHELKTPISIISGYAEGLKLGINSDAQRTFYADVIIEESARMNDMVLSLLDLSRMESGQMPLNPAVYNLSQQLSDTLLRIKPKIESSGAELQTNIEEELYVFADSIQVDKILNNYLSNALSHVNTGGRVIITGKNSEGKVFISVYNDGENIPDHHMERIWESFFRGDTSHKRQSDRVGLGLSIVKAAVSMHKTQCGVQNKTGGVEFWFTLSAADGKSEN